MYYGGPVNSIVRRLHIVVVEGDDMTICNECGEPMEEPTNISIDQRSPCPSCDSKARFYKIELNGKVTFHKKLQLKARHGKIGEVKPFLQLQTGDGLYRKTGEMNHREKIEYNCSQ